MSPRQAADSRTDRDEGGFRERPIFVAPSFRQVFQASGYSSKWIVCRAYAGVRGAYAGRTQAYGERTQSVCRTYAVHGIDSHVRFSLRFWPSLRGFPRFLRCSDCPRVAPSLQAGTAWMETFPPLLSEGWVHNFSELCPHQMAPKIALNFQALHYESGSSGTTSSAAPLGQPFVLN